ncbi:MAG: glycosyltransferase [Ignavibacteria bacterium]|nr:glycosyltransferase [Ignavibacteria bacterium]
MEFQHKVLHIAPENTAGVPYNLTRMQKSFGLESRLITFYKIPYDFPEDICLKIPLSRSKLAMKWRDYKKRKLHQRIENENTDYWTYLPYFSYRNSVEQLFMKVREKRHSGKFEKALEELNAESFDIIHFDGGIDFYSDCRTAIRFKKAGKKIINCYFGDDLRTRGIVKKMDELSDLNLTFEYDHTLRHPDINFLFFPFEDSKLEYIPDEEYFGKGMIRIIHSPTDRYVKGTYEIIEAIEKVKRSRDIEFLLIENTPRNELLKIKRTCHIAIDQIGNRGGTGYGINSLENLSLGIPTITDMNCGMAEWLPENPFLVANKDNLADVIISLLDDESLLRGLRSKSRLWVEKYHSYQSVFSRLRQYYQSIDVNI